ncbi:26S proteasome regulatory subunit rpn12 [Verticillium dahliae VDG2]|nr:26S proteasome regulatory subunit rpn12 [Verticillium dahliae VDG2]
MAKRLDMIFAELGISQYLDNFVEQGFDTWATILDITESDLDVLRVKLGHRRKLQRRIANSRGLAPDDALLVPPVRASVEDMKPETPRPEPFRQEPRHTNVATKRKYRRHPKSDDNAPGRPPSAYVLFANKLAKLVGENWRSLSNLEKEPVETQALNAKQKYNQDLAKYKKTKEFRKYSKYIHDFKQKQLHRTKAVQNGTKHSGTGHGSGSVVGGDVPLARKQRVGSVTLMPDYPFAAATSFSHQDSIEEPVQSPASTAFELERSPTMSSGSPHGSPRRTRCPTWSDTQASPENGAPPHLPSLPDVFNDDRMTGVTRTSEIPAFGGYMPRQTSIEHHAPTMPPLKHEISSGNVASSNSGFSYNRTPNNTSLPIHAPMSSSRSGSSPSFESCLMPVYRQQMTSDQTLPFPAAKPPVSGATGVVSGRSAAYSWPKPWTNAISEHRAPPPLTKIPSSGSSGTTDVSTMLSRTSIGVHNSTGASSKADANLDGMNALLRAGEIVGRCEG